MNDGVPNDVSALDAVRSRLPRKSSSMTAQVGPPCAHLTRADYGSMSSPKIAAGNAAKPVVKAATAQMLLARREQFHQTRLAEYIGSTSQAYVAAAKQLASHFTSYGLGAADAQRRAMAAIGQTITSQVAAFLH
jgi:hypothetical protein